MKTLNDVINAVQQETQLSRSQLSLKIGKSRNYLNTTVKNGLSYDKEQEIIALLLDLVDDETTMLRNVLADKEETIEDYKVELKEVINGKNDEIATKKLFIDGLDMENKGLMDRISKLKKELSKTKNTYGESVGVNFELAESLSKQEEDINDLRQKLNKELTKNRILGASISGLVGIFLVYTWLK